VRRENKGKIRSKIQKALNQRLYHTTKEQFCQARKSLKSSCISSFSDIKTALTVCSQMFLGVGFRKKN